LGISLSGLGSGMDFSSLIDQLVAVERAPVDTVTKRKTNATTRLSTVTALVSKLAALKTKATGLDTAAEVRAVSASVSDSSFSATASGSAAPGSYRVRVTHLATAQEDSSRAFTSADAGVLNEGAVRFTVGDADPVTVSYDSGDTLAEIVGRINDQVDGVTASLLDDGDQYRILIRADETGAENAVGYEESGDSLGLSLESARQIDATDATLTLSGFAVHRASNHITDLVAGVTLDLKAEAETGDADAVLTVARDADGTKTKIKDLVTAFNDVNKIVSAQLSYNGVQRGQDTLFADPAISGLQRALGTLASSGYGGSSLGRYGVTVARDGSLTIDETKLSAAVAADPAGLESLLAGTDRLAEAIKGTVDRYTASDGILTAKSKSLRSEISGYDDQIQRLEDAATSYEERLRKQFTALELALTNMQSQSTYITNVFGS
jgi:flagellar hook-associated protein 2